MAVINLKRKEIQAKIVYYGPGRCGKTSTLEYIHRAYSVRARSKMIKLDTDHGRTLFFDFLPLEIGKVKGFTLRVQLYSTPGQNRYDSCRRVVLRSVDGLVFVADAMEVCRKRNITSFQNLKSNLSRLNKGIHSLPLVVQCNKIDLHDKGVPVINQETLANDLGLDQRIPCLPASTETGQNVIPILKKIILMTASALDKEITKGFDHRLPPQPSSNAPSPPPMNNAANVG